MEWAKGSSTNIDVIMICKGQVGVGCCADGLRQARCQALEVRSSSNCRASTSTDTGAVHLDDDAFLDTETLVSGLGRLSALPSSCLLRMLSLCLFFLLDCLLLACKGRRFDKFAVVVKRI